MVEIMKRCELCGNKIKKSDDASLLLDAELNEKIKKNYKKVKTVCATCKSEMLYAGIMRPW